MRKCQNEICLISPGLEEEDLDWGFLSSLLGVFFSAFSLSLGRSKLELNVVSISSCMQPPEFPLHHLPYPI